MSRAERPAERARRRREGIELVGSDDDHGVGHGRRCHDLEPGGVSTRRGRSQGRRPHIAVVTADVHVVADERGDDRTARRSRTSNVAHRVRIERADVPSSLPTTRRCPPRQATKDRATGRGRPCFTNDPGAGTTARAACGCVLAADDDDGCLRATIAARAYRNDEQYECEDEGPHPRTARLGRRGTTPRPAAASRIRPASRSCTSEVRANRRRTNVRGGRERDGEVPDGRVAVVGIARQRLHDDGLDLGRQRRVPRVRSGRASSFMRRVHKRERAAGGVVRESPHSAS